MNKVISPLTNFDNVKLVKKIEVSDIIERWKSEFKIDISIEFKECGKYIYLYHCLESDLLFYEPKFEGSPYVYKELQNKFDWYYLEDKWEYKVAEKDIKSCKNIIEIGCGKGTFVKKIAKNDINIIGLETSEEAVLNAQKNNLPVYLNTIDKFFIENPDYQADVMISFQVLEHLSDPLKFLKEHISYLKKGSKLILCVPNVDCFYKFSDELLDMPPHHAAKWSRKTFVYLENILPLKIKKIRYEPLHFLHINIWLRNYSKYFRSSKWYGKFLFNKYTTTFLLKILKKDKFRRLIKGHTIYVSFEKQ